MSVLPGVLERIKPYLSRHLLQHLLESCEEIPSERRIVTAIFADLSGFTTISERLDPEEVAEFTSAALERLGAPVIAGDGAVDKYIGDALMAVFGAPIAHADDARRALLAALEMRAAIRSFSARKLNVSIGIHTGLVVAGNIGGAIRKEYSVLGDAVNIAARLEVAARPGEILVSEETVRAAGPSFIYSSPRTLRVKGRRTEVSVRSLIRKNTSVQPTRWVFRRAFIGRENAIAELAAMSERDAFVLVTGVGGIGKTTLIERFRERIKGIRTVHRVKMRYGWRTGSFSFVEKIMRCIPGPKTKLPKDPGAVAKILTARLAHPRPRNSAGLLLLEDVHLADESSLLALKELGSTPGMAIVATARPTPELDSYFRRAERIVLDELVPDEIGEMIRRLLRTERLPKGADLLVRRIGGIPLAVEETVRYLVEQGHFYRAAGAWRYWSAGEKAGGVPEIVRARMDTLSPSTRALLSRVSIFGSAAPWLESRDPLSDRSCKNEVKEAERAGFVKREGANPDGEELAFVHDHYRKVVYETQLLRVRRSLHKKAAAWLKGKRSPPELLAHHYSKADMDTEALPHICAAADHSFDSHAYSTARAYLLRARETTRTLGDRSKEMQILLKLADVDLRMSRNRDAARTLKAARRLMRRGDQFKLELLQREATLAKNVGAVARMKKICIKILATPQARRDPEIRASALQPLGAQAWRDGNYRVAERLYQRILHSTAHGSRRVTIASSLIDLFRLTGKYQKAEALLPEVMDDRPAGWPLLHRGRLRFDQGRMDEAAVDFREAASRAKKNEDPRLETLVLRELARFEIFRGEMKSGLILLEEAVRIADQIPAYAPRAHAEAALIFAQAGDVKRAEKELHATRQRHRRIRLVETEAVLIEALAILGEKRGDIAGASKLYRKAIVIRKKQGARPQVELLRKKHAAILCMMRNP